MRSLRKQEVIKTLDRLAWIPEPSLLFGHGQAMEDPRDGLTLFGPLDGGNSYGIRVGVIGCTSGILRFKEWLTKLQGYIGHTPATHSRPLFPGFQAAFRIPIDRTPVVEITVPVDSLYQALLIDDSHQRVYKTVELFTSRILEVRNENEEAVDLWFIVIPDDVYKYCRPQSSVEPERRVRADLKLSTRKAQEFIKQTTIFPEDFETAKQYQYDVHFHNQLKARLLGYNIPTQIIRESTLMKGLGIEPSSKPYGSQVPLESSIAWNISSAAFYKAGGRPWKLNAIREGVCYIGLVFKQVPNSPDSRYACCAAQMFLDSGDGIVFKGAVGPWYSPVTREYHLSRASARELVSLAVSSYAKQNGHAPKELFLHGKIAFNDDEWDGFQEAVGPETDLVGVRIREGSSDLKLYRSGRYPVLRGIALVEDDTSAYLWTRGFIPRLQTCPGLEVPNPLSIRICRGRADANVVLKDIMALTKLNYNSCGYADGLPVTLRFADMVGEILTAGPITDGQPPLPFKYYI